MPPDTRKEVNRKVAIEKINASALTESVLFPRKTTHKPPKIGSHIVKLKRGKVLNIFNIQISSLKSTVNIRKQVKTKEVRLLHRMHSDTGSQTAPFEP